MATILENPSTTNFNFGHDRQALSPVHTRELSPSLERKQKRTIDQSSARDSEAVPSKKARVDSPIEQNIATPATQTALLVTPERKYRLDTSFPVPQELAEGEIMIRSRAVGLNHIDWKSVEWNFCLPQFPWVTGREMAGVVAKVGSGVSHVKAGDAVWTSTYYKDRRAGCFQEMVVVPKHTVFAIPQNIDFAAAASLGVCGLTAAMSLWHWLDVPMTAEAKSTTSEGTPKEKEVLLIWGGSTVTGQFAIQIAAQTGIEIIAVCSSSNAELVSSLGATHVVTYNGKTDLHIIGEILCLAQGRLTKAVDIVGNDTARQVLRVIEACGRPVQFAPLAFISSKDKIPANATVHTVEMKRFILNAQSEKYGTRLNEMVADGTVKMPKVKLLEGGLGGIEGGLLKLKNGSLAGEKLIVPIP